MARAPAWKQPSASGPVVWWLRNDLRLEDNPVARLAAGEALADGRPGVAVFVFDPRFFDRSPYGRVTDPEFKKSIPTRRPISFGSRKCCALRARFILQCVRSLSARLSAKGSRLLACHGRPEDVFADLPQGSLVACQQEPVSVECSDVEDCVRAALERKGGELRCEWGAMSLYHREDLPFQIKEDEVPNSFTELGMSLGWDDIWSVPERGSSATPVRPPVAAPAVFPSAPSDLQLPGMLSEELLADDAKALRQLGYEEQEIEQALGQAIPEGGEPQARALLEAWLLEQGVAPGGDNPQAPVFWDLPVGSGPGEGHDALQWANLARPDGWTRVSHYLAVGCISAREIFARAAECPNFNGVAHRLLWREWHRLNAIRYGRRLFWLQGPGWVERPWSSEAALAEAWKQGRTGVPYIDACMRELRQTGWLAYKGRKTTAFFLIFGFGIDWRLGAYHFEDALLDYDCAMNYGNWVTVAEVHKPSRASWGSEATVADLVEAYREDIEWKLSAEMANDPSGEYIRRWVPELQRVDAAYVHRPWAMSKEELAKCGLNLGVDYPASLVGPLRVCSDAQEWDHMREAEEDRGEGAGTDGRPGRGGEQRRVHPEDKSGRSYTRGEFGEWAAAMGETEAYAERLWLESVSVADVQSIQRRCAELEAKVEEQERELASLRRAATDGS